MENKMLNFLREVKENEEKVSSYSSNTNKWIQIIIKTLEDNGAHLLLSNEKDPSALLPTFRTNVCTDKYEIRLHATPEILCYQELCIVVVTILLGAQFANTIYNSARNIDELLASKTNFCQYYRELISLIE